MIPVLYTRNAHPRDEHIQFFEDGHKYTISTDPDTEYTSVTTWVKKQFPEFNADIVIENMMNGRGWKAGHKYWGMSPDQIKALWEKTKNEVACKGTELHRDIECFHNDKRFQFEYTNKELLEIYLADKSKELDKTPLEWQYFIQFIKDHQHLKPYRTEWTIYDDTTKIAGSIDMVYENPDGTLSIYDWKRSKQINKVNDFNRFATNPIICHFPDSSYWHYALQLNTYKYILETKYNKQIKDLYLVRLHPDAVEKNYELIKVPDLQNEVMDLLNN